MSRTEARIGGGAWLAHEVAEAMRGQPWHGYSPTEATMNPAVRTAHLLGAAYLCGLLLSAPAAAHAQATSPAQVSLTFLGTGGWKVTDGRTVVLLDPYLTRLPTTALRGVHWTSHGYVADGPGTDPVLYPDTAMLATALPRADYILVTHCHADHLLDVPFVARRTGARVIGNENAARLLRATGVADSQIITVRGGEDFDLGSFSVRAMPGLHSYVGGIGYYDGRSVPENLKAPLRATDYFEGGTLAYVVRMGGHEILFLGSVFIESELRGLRPDVVVVSPAGHQFTYDFTRRLLALTGAPPLLLPSHWDNFTLPLTDPMAAGSPETLRHLALFADEVHRYAPATKVVTPRFNEPIVLPEARRILSAP